MDEMKEIVGQAKVIFGQFDTSCVFEVERVREVTESGNVSGIYDNLIISVYQRSNTCCETNIRIYSFTKEELRFLGKTLCSLADATEETFLKDMEQVEVENAMNKANQKAAREAILAKLSDEEKAILGYK